MPQIPVMPGLLVSGSGEIGIRDLLSGIYSDSFTPMGSNATVFTSVGGFTDQIWEDGIANITAEAKYAGYSQPFGYTDVQYNELFNIAGGSSTNFLEPKPISADLDLTGKLWTWDRSDVDGNILTLGNLQSICSKNAADNDVN